MLVAASPLVPTNGVLVPRKLRDLSATQPLRTANQPHARSRAHLTTPPPPTPSARTRTLIALGGKAAKRPMKRPQPALVDPAKRPLGARPQPAALHLAPSKSSQPAKAAARRDGGPWTAEALERLRSTIERIESRMVAGPPPLTPPPAPPAETAREVSTSDADSSAPADSNGTWPPTALHAHDEAIDEEALAAAKARADTICARLRLQKQARRILYERRLREHGMVDIPESPCVSHFSSFQSERAPSP
jgi:hypothetical protein